MQYEDYYNANPLRASLNNSHFARERVQSADFSGGAWMSDAGTIYNCFLELIAHVEMACYTKLHKMRPGERYIVL